ncbi:MAG: pur operon repressor, partial [Clostridiales bacterium]|nr:pur operon repressor [Clostridiales bacterium]
MVKAKRNERIAVITRILCENPGKLFNLSYFSSLLGATKSSLSEDVSGLKELFEARGLGRVETLPGAAGGVRYIPVVSDEQQEEYLSGLALTLSDSRRALSGGYIYMADLMNNPEQLGCMAQALIRPFINKRADFILTIETKGIPIALMSARALNLPLVVARRENRINEGPLVTINYLSGSGKSMQTMSLPRRAAA